MFIYMCLRTYCIGQRVAALDEYRLHSLGDSVKYSVRPCTAVGNTVSMYTVYLRTLAAGQICKQQSVFQPKRPVRKIQHNNTWQKYHTRKHDINIKPLKYHSFTQLIYPWISMFCRDDQ